MNILEKVQTIRVELKKLPLKMTGKNAFAKYDYFELNDFLKPLNELMQKYKMTAIVSFTKEEAKLTAYNCEAPEEQIEIRSPFGSAELKGCHDVQNIGAVETYQRRYLYQALFDISENDALNATQGREDPKEKPSSSKQTECRCAVCGKSISQKLYERSIEKYGTAFCSAECKEEADK